MEHVLENVSDESFVKIASGDRTFVIAVVPLKPEIKDGDRVTIKSDQGLGLAFIAGDVALLSAVQGQGHVVISIKERGCHERISIKPQQEEGPDVSGDGSGESLPEFAGTDEGEKTPWDKEAESIESASMEDERDGDIEPHEDLDAVGAGGEDITATNDSEDE